ncbi:uncharacterized protein LOC117008004 [Catharus ustulatus]|uniref:uncharacterized protein LOC117008004 n=1 Tax=Catharus ustulatus TaxID=91951 RepID=UPI0014081944|nr:uncharacterized protein LOC117008004 [Catharus ustulatus]
MSPSTPAHGASTAQQGPAAALSTAACRDLGARQKLKSLQECQRCPAGKYCEFAGLAAPTGDCAEGFWCRSGARVRNPQDGESGLPCPAGHYCPEGYFCALPGQSQVTGPCLPGFYCTGGAASPTPRDALVGNSCPKDPTALWALPPPCPALLAGTAAQLGTLGSRTASSVMQVISAMGLGWCLPTGLCEAGFYCSGGSPFPQTGQAQCQWGSLPPGALL